MNKKNLAAFLIVIIFFLGVFFLVKHFPKNSAIVIYSPAVSQAPQNIQYVEIGGQKIKVDLALTEAEQTQGLSGRQNLSPNTGMLFVFATPGKQLFWMPDMNFPIDMIWFTPPEGGDASKVKVDYIEKDATPASYPAEFGPGVNDGMAQYVLEIASGFSDQNNLKVGDSVQFVY